MEWEIGNGLLVIGNEYYLVLKLTPDALSFILYFVGYLASL